MFYIVLSFVPTRGLLFLTGLTIQVRVWVSQAFGTLRTGSGSLIHRQVFCVVKQCRVEWECATVNYRVVVHTVRVADLLLDNMQFATSICLSCGFLQYPSRRHLLQYRPATTAPTR